MLMSQHYSAVCVFPPPFLSFLCVCVWTYVSDCLYTSQSCLTHLDTFSLGPSSSTQTHRRYVTPLFYVMTAAALSSSTHPFQFSPAPRPDGSQAVCSQKKKNVFTCVMAHLQSGILERYVKYKGQLQLLSNSVGLGCMIRSYCILLYVSIWLHIMFCWRVSQMENSFDVHIKQS